MKRTGLTVLICLAALLILAAVTAVFGCCSRTAATGEETTEETVSSGYHRGSDIFYYRGDTVYRRDSKTGREYTVYQFEYPCDDFIYEENDFLCLSGGMLYKGTYDGYVHLVYSTYENEPSLVARVGETGNWLWFSTNDVFYPYAEINRVDETCHLLKDLTDAAAFH